MATLYVDASRLDDTGDGLSPATAKKTLRGARLAMDSALNKVFVKAGQIHAPIAGRFIDQTVSGTSGLHIFSYGDGDKPVWDSLSYNVEGTGGWTYVSDGVWKRVAGAWYVRRMFAGARNTGILRGQRNPGTPLRRAPVSGTTSSTQNAAEATIVSSLSANLPWAPGGALTGFAVYVYTGSASISPDVFYSGLSWVQADGASVGAVWPIQIKSSQNVVIKDQEFWSSGDACIRATTANADAFDVANIEIAHCDFRYVYGSGVSLRGLSEISPTRFIRDVSIHRCLVDTDTSETEQEVTLGETSLSGSGDLIQVEQRSLNVNIYRNVIRNPGHAGIVIGTSFSNDAPQSCSALRNVVEFSPWAAYGRGVAVYNGSGHRIQGNLFIGQNVRSQFAGTVLIAHNEWRDCRPSIRKPDTDQAFACESYYYDNGSGLGNSIRYVNITPVAVSIKNNTFNCLPGVTSTDFARFSSYGNAFPVGGTAWSPGAVVISGNDASGWNTSVLLRTTDGGGNAPTIPLETVSNNRTATSSTSSFRNGVAYGINELAGTSGNSTTASSPRANYVFARGLSGGQPVINGTGIGCVSSKKRMTKK